MDKMQHIYQMLMVLSFITNFILKKYAVSECACWHLIFSITSSSISDFILVFYGKEVRISIYLAFHFIHYYNVLSCIKEQNLFTFVVNCIFK